MEGISRPGGKVSLAGDSSHSILLCGGGATCHLPHSPVVQNLALDVLVDALAPLDEFDGHEVTRSLIAAELGHAKVAAPDVLRAVRGEAAEG
jgi:hypothetical protein